MVFKMSRPVANFKAISKNKDNKETKKTKKIVMEEEVKASRSIVFAKRPWQNRLTIFFFLLFFGISIVLIMTFGRLETLTNYANAKALNKEQLVTEVRDNLSNQDLMVYQGEAFVKALINSSADSEEKDTEQEEILQPYLAKGFPVDSLNFSSDNTNRSVEDISLIKKELTDQKKNIYELSYFVQYSEGNQEISIDLSFPVSYQSGQAKVLDVPHIYNMESRKDTNTVSYSGSNYDLVGKKVSEGEKTKMKDFVSNFFDLFVKNDEKLGLIADVKGLDNAILVNEELLNAAETSKDHVTITGTYSIRFGKGGVIESPYTLKLKKSNDTYFVESIE